MACIVTVHSFVLGIYSSEERTMLVAEKLIRSLVDNMEDIQFILMVVYGIQKHAM